MISYTRRCQIYLLQLDRSFEGFEEKQLDPAPEQIIIGNSGLPRGNPAIEYILERGLNYVSGAEWLGETILRDKWVLAVSGTHGKTTTASMLVWILEKAGLNPGFLIGGAPLNFGVSSRLEAIHFSLSRQMNMTPAISIDDRNLSTIVPEL